MDEYGWGLTSRGFRRPTYTELLDALEYKARGAVGSKSKPDRAQARSACFCASLHGS